MSLSSSGGKDKDLKIGLDDMDREARERAEEGPEEGPEETDEAIKVIKNISQEISTADLIEIGLKDMARERELSGREESQP